MLTGNINRIDRERKFGFIYVTGRDGLIFFHQNDLENCNLRQLEEGDTVEFYLGPGRDGKDKAIRIRKKFQASQNLLSASPGINPSVRTDHFNEDERKIIQHLGKVFYVTSGGEEFSIAKSNYRYCLIKPTEFFNQTFQLSREIVVVFSDYVSFEPRTLDAASYVYKSIPTKLRLDRGCHLLVCHDNQIEEKLSALLKDSNVNQIVIPFTYSELLTNHNTSDLIKERFRKYLFDTDLFSVSAPIQDDVFFFGRRDYVHDIVSKCKNSTNSGVFGLRRSGKTSLLYAVQRLLKQQSYPTVFIPCESDLSNLDWRTALCKVVLDVYQALGVDNSKIRESDYNDTPNATIYFEEDMDYALASLRLPVTLMFDEIEAITFGVTQGETSSNLWVDGSSFVAFWNTIKGYYSKNPRKISILVAGTNPMINEVPVINNTPNPMFRQLSESNQGAYLPAFTNEDTKNMVNMLGGYMGLQFDEYTIGKLTSDCGGHPYLMRILCSFINKYMRTNGIRRPAVVTRAIYDKAVPEFEKSSEATSFFWMILNILMTGYPKEFSTLKVLALQGDSIISQIQDKDSLFHLIGYGLVEYNQNNYAIKYSTITHFLRGEYRFERQGLSVEEQKEEISLRINNAEMQLRKLVKNTLQSVKGTQKAKDAVITSMSSNRAISDSDLSRAQTLSYVQLFDPSMNKMYFSLLMGIILDNITVFENVFEASDETTIRKNLSVINSARRCPDHSFTENSENWSWDDFEKFRASISWLENILSNYE